VDKTIPKGGACSLPRLHCVDYWSDFHEIGPGAGNNIDKVRMHPGAQSIIRDSFYGASIQYT
jgi:hypothetical protein